VARRRQERWYAFAALVLRPLMTVLTRRSWTHTDRLPRSGGVVVVPNHISHVDPLAVAHFLYDNGRLPRFLAKASLFEVFFVRRVLRGAKQIPVYRETRDAQDAYREAVEAVLRGECVVVYAEGTLTRDADLWPMAGKTGAARIALETGCPVLPLAAWGPQQLLPPYSKRPHLFPRPTMQVTVGEPVELSDLRERRGDPKVLREATDRIMAALTALVGELRGQTPPRTRLDSRAAELAATGNAHVEYRLYRRGPAGRDRPAVPDPKVPGERQGNLP
jgi:1-acyl-sn-glycerol-3-phosphate acyltransferase